MAVDEDAHGLAVVRRGGEARKRKRVLRYAQARIYSGICPFTIRTAKYTEWNWPSESSSLTMLGNQNSICRIPSMERLCKVWLKVQIVWSLSFRYT